MDHKVYLAPTPTQRFVYATAGAAVGYALFRAISAIRPDALASLSVRAQVLSFGAAALAGSLPAPKSEIIWGEAEAGSKACELGTFMLDQKDHEFAHLFEHAARTCEIDHLERQVASGIPFAKLQYSDPSRTAYLRANLMNRLVKRSGDGEARGIADEALQEMKESIVSE